MRGLSDVLARDPTSHRLDAAGVMPHRRSQSKGACGNGVTSTDLMTVPTQVSGNLSIAQVANGWLYSLALLHLV